MPAQDTEVLGPTHETASPTETRPAIVVMTPLGVLVPAHENPTSKHIACGDVVPGCTFTASAPTEEELLKKVVAHAAHDHGVTEVTPELAAKVKAAIKSQ